MCHILLPTAGVEDTPDSLDDSEVDMLDDAVEVRVQAATSIVEDHYKQPGTIIFQANLLSEIKNLVYPN